MTEILKADFRQVRDLESDMRAAGAAGLKAGVEQAEEGLRSEARPISRRLEEGVSSELKPGGNKLEARLIVSAVTPEQPSLTAEVIGASGEVKKVSLRPQKPYDFAEIVSTGRPEVHPKKARSLLIPASSARLKPDSKRESYLRVGGKTYVMRRQAKAVPPNPYDERAARHTELVVEEVAGRAVADSLSRSSGGK